MRRLRLSNPRAINSLVGITQTQIDLDQGFVSFEAKTQSARAKALQKLAEMGYPELGNNSLGTKAKSYVSCMIGRLKS